MRISDWSSDVCSSDLLVQRDGIERLRYAKRYSRQYSTICTKLVATGWNAACGARRGPDAREMVESDLIVVWGGNPVNTQVNVMTWVAKARKARGAKLVVEIGRAHV